MDQTATSPESVGVSAQGIARLHALLNERVEQGRISSLSLAVARRGVTADLWTCGKGLSPSTRFLVASLSKPVTAAVVMRLIEEGELALSTPAASVLPAFKGEGREAIQVIHLLTHTSGLPDMVPENVELRRRHAPLSEFFEAVCRTPLLFEPGTANSYQSMGSLVLSTIVEKVTGKTFAHFAREELFIPAGMNDTVFGLPEGDDGAGDAPVDLPDDQKSTDYHWNSPYWRRLGAPWGGLITTAADLTKLLQLILAADSTSGSSTYASSGPTYSTTAASTTAASTAAASASAASASTASATAASASISDSRPLSVAACRAMIKNWLGGRGPEFAPWGLGWKIKGRPLESHWNRHSVAADAAAGAQDSPAQAKPNSFTTAGITAAHSRRFFGDLTSERAFGHTGATGCAMWADPETSLSVVLLTTTPAVLQGDTLPLVANVVKAAEI